MYCQSLIINVISSLYEECIQVVAGYSLHRLMLLLGVVLATWVVYELGYRIVRPLLKKLVTRTNVVWDDYLLNDEVLRSTCQFLPPLILLFSFSFIYPEDLYLYGVEFFFKEVLHRAIKIYAIIMFIRWGFSFLNGIRRVAEEHADHRSGYLTGLFQLLKIAMVFIGTIFVIGIIISRSPLALIAGLGAMATILMLIFKDPILGMVAGIQLSSNDMLRKGDWITMTSSGANGYIEEITLTTVKVRNFDNTITTIPPYTLVSQSFQNWRGMKASGGRRVKRALYIDVNSIRICTPDEQAFFQQKGWGSTHVDQMELVNLTAFRNAIEDYLSTLPEVNQELTFMVRQLEPTANGIPLEIYFFLCAKEWVVFEHQASDIFAHVVALLPEFGLRLYQTPSGMDFRESLTSSER